MHMYLEEYLPHPPSIKAFLVRGHGAIHGHAHAPRIDVHHQHFLWVRENVQEILQPQLMLPLGLDSQVRMFACIPGFGGGQECLEGGLHLRTHTYTYIHCVSNRISTTFDGNNETMHNNLLLVHNLSEK